MVEGLGKYLKMSNNFLLREKKYNPDIFDLKEKLFIKNW